MKLVKSIFYYLKLFVLYTILEKAIWLSPFLILLLAAFAYDVGLPETTLATTIFVALLFAAIIGLLFWYFKKRKNINIFEYVKLTTLTNSKRNLLLSILILVAYCAYVFILQSPTVHQGLNLVVYPKTTLPYAIYMFIAVLWEEIVARGIILQLLAKKIGFTKANLLTAAIFTAGHYFLAGGNVGQENLLFTWTSLTVVSVILRFILGYMAGVILRTSNSIWFSAVLHLCNNIIH